MVFVKDAIWILHLRGQEQISTTQLKPLVSNITVFEIHFPNLVWHINHMHLVKQLYNTKLFRGGMVKTLALYLKGQRFEPNLADCCPQ